MPCKPNTAYYKRKESQFFSTLFSVPVQGTLFSLGVKILLLFCTFLTTLLRFFGSIFFSCGDTISSYSLQFSSSSVLQKQTCCQISG